MGALLLVASLAFADPPIVFAPEPLAPEVDPEVERLARRYRVNNAVATFGAASPVIAVGVFAVGAIAIRNNCQELGCILVPAAFATPAILLGPPALSWGAWRGCRNLQALDQTEKQCVLGAVSLGLSLAAYPLAVVPGLYGTASLAGYITGLVQFGLNVDQWRTGQNELSVSIRPLWDDRKRGVLISGAF